MHTRRLVQHLGRQLWFRRAKRVGIYWPSDGEIDPLTLLGRQRGKQWHLPVLQRFPRKTLMFVRWRPGERLMANRFGIPEPQRRGRRIRNAQSLDLLLMPVVGFDRDGHRIGRGGGFYDRSLAYLRRHPLWRRPRLIGLAHACQRLDQITPKPWDVPVDAIATEDGVSASRPRRAPQVPAAA